MTPQLLSALFRISWLYAVDGVSHALRQYCECTPSADPSGNDVIFKAGTANVGVSTVCDPVFTAMAPAYNNTLTGFNGIILEKRDVITNAWSFLYAQATAVVATNTNPYGKAMGLCLAGKDHLNRFMPVYLYEGTFQQVTKSQSYAGLGAVNQAMIDLFWNVGGAATASMPWSFRSSKDDTGHSGRWLSFVVDSNQKLRRVRRIA